MSIEVILKEHVEHLGRRGEIVKVANGYARTLNGRPPAAFALPLEVLAERPAMLRGETPGGLIPADRRVVGVQAK